MTLDPQVQALLDQMQQEPPPKLFEVPLVEARGFGREMGKMFGAPDIPIGACEDRRIPGPAGDIPVRIYTPMEAGADPLACIVYYHGGGMVVGDLDGYDSLCRQLSNETGARVVSVDYRLAPEAKFPAAVDDAYAALEWVAANAAELGVDPSRIVAAGDSAGGNLSAVVSLLARDRKGPPIAFQLLIYPWTDANPETASRSDLAEGYFLDAATMDWFLDQYVSSREEHDDPRMSPLRAKDFAGLPPAHVITAGFDPLKDEGRAYADRLAAAGVKVTHKEYPGMIHGFFAMAGVLDQGRIAIKEATQALKAAI